MSQIDYFNTAALLGRPLVGEVSMKHRLFCLVTALAALSPRAAEPATPPAAATDTASHVVLQPGKKLGEKATVHRFEKLRAGAIKTDKGWNVQDFASAFFNPNREEITVTMKMVSDDPKFVFNNGQVGTFTKTYRLKPLLGITDNIYICTAFGVAKREWPVSPGTNFTGSVEFTGSKPFYYYLLRETEVGEAPDDTDAYFKGWRTWRDDVPVAWDSDLRRFVVPYTNYWHNDANWPVGWHSLLTLKNRTDGPVTCTVKHVPYYGIVFNPKNGQSTRYKEQVVKVVLQKQEEKKATLQELFGWPTDQMNAMEGYLLILPSRDAPAGTEAHFSVIPNDSGERMHSITEAEYKSSLHSVIPSDLGERPHNAVPPAETPARR
jgi:hypothetical protein